MIKINFKAEDFVDNKFLSCNDCAIARATKRAFPDKDVLAGGFDVAIDDIDYNMLAVSINDKNVGRILTTEHFEYFQNMFIKNPNTDAHILIDMSTEKAESLGFKS